MGEKVGFVLPRLTSGIDCEPIGYPGIAVVFWLNVTYDGARVSDEEWAAGHPGEKREPWDTDFYYNLARIVEEVYVPDIYTTEFIDDGVATTIPIRCGKDLYDLMHTDGFEQNIVLWAAGQYYNVRQERLRAEVKN